MFLQLLFQMMVIIWCWQITLVSSSLSFFQTKPGCESKCGNLSIPYPFGILPSSSSSGKDCSIDGAIGSYGFSINCNTSYNPPKAFLASGKGKLEQFYVLTGETLEPNLEILSISESEIRLKTWQTTTCFDKSGGLLTSYAQFVYANFIGSPFTFSETKNRVFAVGCDTFASILMYDNVKNYTNTCQSVCDSRRNVLDSCTGSGCCQMTFPKGLKKFIGVEMSPNNHTEVWPFNPCSSIFMAEEDHYKFNPATDLLNPPQNMSLVYKEDNQDKPIPVVLNWALGNQTCEEARKDLATFACHQDYNSNCIDSDNGLGYRCSCNKGFEGNPYLSPGCQDVNECEDSTNNPCEEICTNTIGSYSCTCKKGSSGDGRKDGSRCTLDNKEFPIIKVAIGTGVAFVSLIIVGSWLFLAIRKRKLAGLKKKFFQQNGGLQLQKQIGSHENGVQSTQIFTAKELKKATNNYDKNLVLGRGGFGTVYKGTLSDNRVVAIKKSKIVDQSQIEQFINEVVILTQVHHRNVVKLLGCCLETEVPLLVYEYVSNGTLSHHLYHKVNGISTISWEGRLRIAAETASALGYLHSAAAVPVIHRDMKSANILLDENYTAKVSDFGASMLVPLDRTQVTTLVQGTIGYLDPEYFLTSQLTEKSDVYSFGVVLVELLTGEKPLNLERSEEQRYFTTYFISSLGDRRMFELLLDARVLKEGKQDQILIVAKLAERCLNMEGKDRPKMIEVAAELEGLRRMLETRTPGTDYGNPNHGNEKTHKLEAGDLYPVPLTADLYMETDMTMSMNIPP